tara:strand:- start:4479 stop:4745 length:267 start_codon:yes stop_codon:yes gene_type:complete
MANTIAVLISEVEVAYVSGADLDLVFDAVVKARNARALCTWMSYSDDVDEAYGLLMGLISHRQPQERTLRVISALQMECNGHALPSDL